MGTQDPGNHLTGPLFRKKWLWDVLYNSFAPASRAALLRCMGCSDFSQGSSDKCFSHGYNHSLKGLFAFLRVTLLSARNGLKVTKCLAMKIEQWCLLGLRLPPAFLEKLHACLSSTPHGWMGTCGTSRLSCATLWACGALTSGCCVVTGLPSAPGPGERRTCHLHERWREHVHPRAAPATRGRACVLSGRLLRTG